VSPSKRPIDVQKAVRNVKDMKYREQIWLGSIPTVPMTYSNRSMRAILVSAQRLPRTEPCFKASSDDAAERLLTARFESPAFCCQIPV
jgi:hypothetical protein